MNEAARSLQQAINGCERARALIGGQSGLKVRTLLDMLLIELGKDLARAMDCDPRRPSRPE
ncbi:hypothetical protein GCM10007887_07330 [Methylobacterium haplocladii]|uniref:Uncharacterized protein n=1 Tax=Methylobacterium haplocladii TaxID=1176176 RepID=A0A512IMJ6_9HYPH|nr:hypothetical protein MHA02_13210 [Methylobacterium haplocladii]GLS58077.1 hypothetical protein GCM10007887_07330 [Methylobacterium haplocladii]